MTDRERWMTCTDPAWMLAALGEQADERRKRIFVELCEKEYDRTNPAFAEWGWADRFDAYYNADRNFESWIRDGGVTIQDENEVTAKFRCDLIRCLWPSPFIERERVECPECKLGWVCGSDDWWEACKKCDGKGFTLAPIIDPRWRTPLVLNLAMKIAGVSQRIRLDEEPIKPQPELMPILADALMDAGCEVREIIEHMRCGVHVSGECWVIAEILR